MGFWGLGFDSGFRGPSPKRYGAAGPGSGLLTSSKQDKGGEFGLVGFRVYGLGGFGDRGLGFRV